MRIKFERKKNTRIVKLKNNQIKKLTHVKKTTIKKFEIKSDKIEN